MAKTVRLIDCMTVQCFFFFCYFLWFISVLCSVLRSCIPAFQLAQPSTSMTQTHVFGKINSHRILYQCNAPAFGVIFPHKNYPFYGNSRTDCDGYHNLNRRHWGPQQLLLSFSLLKHWDRLCDKPFDRKQPFHPTGCHSGSCGSSDSSVDYCYCGNPSCYYTEEEEREGWKTPARNSLEVTKTH